MSPETVLDAAVIRRRPRGTIELVGEIQRSGERGGPSEADEALGAPTTTPSRWCGQRSG